MRRGERERRGKREIEESYNKAAEIIEMTKPETRGPNPETNAESER